MTKVLIITNKNDITSDFVVKKLKERCINFYRFNTEELSHTCFITIDLENDRYVIWDKNTNIEHDLKLFSAVYYRRPELPKIVKDNLEKPVKLFSLKMNCTLRLKEYIKYSRMSFG
jgi:hypothetical protein